MATGRRDSSPELLVTLVGDEETGRFESRSVFEVDSDLPLSLDKG